MIAGVKVLFAGLSTFSNTTAGQATVLSRGGVSSASQEGRHRGSLQGSLLSGRRSFGGMMEHVRSPSLIPQAMWSVKFHRYGHPRVARPAAKSGRSFGPRGHASAAGRGDLMVVT